ncbi:solute carrier family 13 member 5 isoform X2 [Lingula anatina]|uniref:Solute carrier family 13 member 5 isoform X2 n=1 Tax=Lingula anatina TaxID=7574 RepID=A0A2R2MSU4_LINAN|nr:solute carrier family 13 member 5 isoform X2 [Lingula anatina]|eukprot:XP_023933335.1 solute carrier family 13 member 5 isoform X2 [Lingula anatina]
MLILREIWDLRKTWVIIITPLLLLPLPLFLGTPHSQHSEGLCAYVIMLMAVYWLTEAIPIAVTALMPVVLMPLLGLLPLKEVAPLYFKDIIMLFMGGLSVAIAIEKWNLHQRIALKILGTVGANPRLLMLGFMAPTWFLSMWISNTASTAMMIPIVQAVLDQLKDHSENEGIFEDAVEHTETENEVLSEGTTGQPKASSEDAVTRTNFNMVVSSSTAHLTEMGEGNPDRDHKQLCKCMCIAVAYSATVGGIASLTGTPPNLVMKGQLDIIFEDNDDTNPITFASWMAFAAPTSAICLLLSWIYLQLFYFRCRSVKTDSSVKTVIRAQYKDLGPISFAEVMVFLHFLLLAVLWITRDLAGWGDLFKKGYVGDGVPAIAVTILLFMAPSHRPRVFCCRDAAASENPSPHTALLDWPSVHQKMPWGVILLLGGGFAIAESAQRSGLSVLVGGALASLDTVSPLVLLLLITTTVCFLTEVASNTTIATLMIPILAELAIKTGVHPIYFVFPPTLAASFAFMLPVATPPNAVVFAYGHLKIKDMMMTGIGMNILCLLVVNLAANTWGYAYFSLGQPPAWVQSTANTTATTLLMNTTTSTMPTATTLLMNTTTSTMPTATTLLVNMTTTAPAGP